MNPEEIVAAAWDAFAKADGYTVASLATEDSLAEYRVQLIAEIDHGRRPQPLEEYLAEMGDVPRDVGEHRWQQNESYRVQRLPQLLAKFAGTASLDELRTLPAPELLTRAMRALPEHFRAAVILSGHVVEPPDRAHVLFRLEFMNAVTKGVDAPRVATVRRTGDAWRLELDPPSPWGMPGYESFWYMTSPPTDDEGALTPAQPDSSP